LSQAPVPSIQASAAFDVRAREVQRTNWDQIARRWDPHREDQGLNPVRLALFAEHLSSPILLIGAGQGRVLSALRAMVPEAIGIDWSLEMVAAGVRRGATNLMPGDAGDLPFGPGRFASAIVSTGVVLPSTGPVRFRRYAIEAMRVLRPGGDLVLCVFFEGDPEKNRRAMAAIRVPLDTLASPGFADLSSVAQELEESGGAVRSAIVDGDFAALVTTKG
jgi:SAM-dependent methyltransferase